ncbi:MAG: rhomboid family intramembrane serine protease [Flavobacteriales bacterium]|tara:strand:- start:3088 stop:3732 length:645 start_codon:yes stop_codon:yes gene_type:complete
MSTQRKYSIFILPALFILVLFIVEWIEHTYGIRFAKYGVLPRTLEGLKGVLLSPFIHSDWKHLTNNALPLFVLTATLGFFYKGIAKEVFLWSWFISGLWLWAIGRPSFHIGASGLLYALASFLFFSGFIRKHTKLMSISMFVVFLYGGMVWGIFPMKKHISWEGHLAGALAGLILAYWFKDNGPPKQVYQYEIDELLEEQKQTYTYEYKEKEKN